MTDRFDDGAQEPVTGWAVRPFLDAARGRPAAAGGGVEPPDGRSGPGVRPFVVTGGRTAAEDDLAVEAQVITTKAGQEALPTLAFEYADIVELCVEPLAVAEVAARLQLQLGVAQVLLRDLTRSGHVTTFEPEAGLSDDVHTILRVIDGLRQLS